MSDPTTIHVHRDRRAQAVRRGAGMGIAARVVSVSCTLAQVPIALRYLGADGFGLWMTLMSIAGMIGMADLGLSLGAKTLLAQLIGRDDLAAARRLTDRAFHRLIVVAAIVAVLGVIAAWSADWARVFEISNPLLQRQLPWALTALAVFSAAALPLAMGMSLAAAVQLTWVQHVATAAGGALTLLIVVLGAWAHATWLTIVVASLALPAAINAAMWWSVRARLGWRGAAAAGNDDADAKELWRLSRWFVLPQVGSLFMVMSVPVVIAAFAGPVAVAGFNLLQRVFGIVNQAHWMALLALWPAYGDAHARADHAWMRGAFRQSWVATIALFVPATLVIAALMPMLVRFWVGHESLDLTAALIWTSAIWFSLQLLGQPAAVLLNGVGRLRTVAIGGTIGHAISIAAMIVGGKLAGAPGVVAGMIAGYALVGLPVALVEAARALRSPAP